MNTRIGIATVGLCLFGAVATLDAGGEAAAADSLAITIYEDNFALLRHQRDYDLSPGENSIELDQLSDQLQVDTVLVRHATNPALLNVLEIAYRHQPLTPQSLLQAHVGRTVGLLRRHPLADTDQRSSARLLSVDGGIVLEVDGRIETSAPGRLVFDGIPAGLSISPSLEVRLVSQRSGGQPVEISYLSPGFGWKTDYVAELSRDGSNASLDAWAELNNNTRAQIDGARVQLVSGRINRVQAERRRQPMLEMARMAAADVATAPPPREILGDYHLYRLPRPVSLAPGESRRIALLSARQVPVETLYRVEAGAPHLYQSRFAGPEQPVPVRRWIRMHNRKAHNLGDPLPAGVVRIYQRDTRGDQQLLGEDRTAHTADGEPLLLALGNAFDLSAHKVQLSLDKLTAEGIYRNAYRSEFRVRLANGSDRPVNIEVIENLPGDWRIESENHPHERRSAAEAVWTVTVPAKGEVPLRYQAVVRY